MLPMGAEFSSDFLSDAQVIVIAFGFFSMMIAVTIFWEIAIIGVLLMSLGETHLGFDFGFLAMGYTVSPFDLLSAALVSAACFRFLVAGSMSRVQLLWMVILGYGFLRFLGGMVDFGLPTAVSFYRQSFYVASALFYSLTIDWTPERLERLVKIWLVMGLMLACVTIIEWLFPNSVPHSATWDSVSLNVFDRSRVVPAAAALIMAQAGIIGLVVWSEARSSVLMRVLCIFLLAISFGLFHRSVWVAAAAGIAVLLAFSRESLIRVVPFIVLGIAAAAVMWMFQQGLGGDFLTRAVQSAVQEPFAEDSSFAWRVTGWELLLERAFSSGWGTVIFGAGYGAGYERQIGWSTVLYSPHNFYIATLLDTGLIGVGLWVYGFARITLGLLGALPSGFLALRPGLMALFATIVVYDIPYNHLTEQGVWIAALASTAGALLVRQNATSAPLVMKP
jgi:hypothetical protein